MWNKSWDAEAGRAFGVEQWGLMRNEAQIQANASELGPDDIPSTFEAGAEDHSTFTANSGRALPASLMPIGGVRGAPQMGNSGRVLPKSGWNLYTTKP